MPAPIFAPLPTPEEMASWDALAIQEYGFKGETLMENAARSAMAVLEDEYGPVAGSTALVLCGSGNNGGDGFALARMLADRGARVRVLHTRPRRHYKGHARHHLSLAARLGVELTPVSRVNLAGVPCPDILVDGLLGTGLRGPLNDKALGLVRFINLLGELGAFVLALDTPSGLCGRTGRPLPEAVHADATATFGAAKLGLVLPDALDYVGVLRVMDIGLPSICREKRPVGQELITPAVMDLLPPAERDLHKGRAGRVLIVGGSKGLTGAPHLAGLGALRAGAGLVTVACPADLAEPIRGGRPDLMTLPLGRGSAWTKDMAHELLERLAGSDTRYDCLAIGPGLGREPETEAFLAALLPHIMKPVVLDADALYHLASRPELLPGRAVLTPHPGEMARLTGKSVDAVQQDRVGLAREFAVEHGCVLALKGPGTVVASPERLVRVCPLSAPCLAVGGSGDVLSGLLAALCARGLSPLQAACLGVYWHGLAGLLLENDHPARGNLASDIAHALPRAAKECTCPSSKTS